jgi:hypothetical protein
MPSWARNPVLHGAFWHFCSFGLRVFTGREVFPSDRLMFQRLSETRFQSWRTTRYTHILHMFLSTK